MSAKGVLVLGDGSLLNRQNIGNAEMVVQEHARVSQCVFDMCDIVVNDGAVFDRNLATNCRVILEAGSLGGSNALDGCDVTDKRNRATTQGADQ